VHSFGYVGDGRRLSQRGLGCPEQNMCWRNRELGDMRVQDETPMVISIYHIP
jgi:hypothetical protein